MATDTGAEPGLQFPLDWHGKVLAQADAGDIPGQIGEVMRSFGIAAATVPGNRSAQGRYLTRLSTVTQFVTAEPPTLNETPI